MALLSLRMALCAWVTVISGKKYEGFALESSADAQTSEKAFHWRLERKTSNPKGLSCSPGFCNTPVGWVYLAQPVCGHISALADRKCLLWREQTDTRMLLNQVGRSSSDLRAVWLLSCWEVKGFAWEQSHINSMRVSGLSLVTSVQEESLNQANVWWLHVAAEAQPAHHLLHTRDGWEGTVARHSDLQASFFFFFLPFSFFSVLRDLNLHHKTQHSQYP